MNETICALATTPGYGAIAIVKVSGPDAIKIVNRIFKGSDLTKKESHSINYGYIYHENQYVDEVLVMLMKAPRTYTKEDVVEINCHGGYITAEKVINILIQQGCELAKEGEFTKRAFLNNRISLLEADAINSIINAQTTTTQELAINNLKNKPSNMINKIRSQLMEILANILVNIDYPEYLDINQLTDVKVKEHLEPIIKEIEIIIRDSENAVKLNEGINIAIIGKPNVGKSSFLNAIIKEEKAIVTNIPGTTRDFIESKTLINGILINFIDTAGIRETTDVVEQIGVEKTKEVINRADIIILMTSYNEDLTKEESELIDDINPDLIIINKKDQTKKIKEENIENYKNIKISTYDLKDINKVEDEIGKMIKKKDMSIKNMTFLSTSASISKIKQANQILKQSVTAISNKLPIDMIETEIQTAWEILGEIIGEQYDEELLDNLFSMFCVGK